MTIGPPDLTVNSIRYNPVTRQIEAEIANIGEFSTIVELSNGKFNVTCYKVLQGYSPVIYSQDDHGPLDAGRTETASFPPPSSGTYTIQCTADAKSWVDEGDFEHESNNAKSATVTVP